MSITCNMEFGNHVLRETPFMGPINVSYMRSWSRQFPPLVSYMWSLWPIVYHISTHHDEYYTFVFSHTCNRHLRSLRFTVGWPLMSCTHTGISPSVSGHPTVKRRLRNVPIYVIPSVDQINLVSKSISPITHMSSWYHPMLFSRIRCSYQNWLCLVFIAY